ncbi:MAG: hypothetical protein ACLPT6_11570 [Desulfobaccales bacterium]
MQKIVKIIKRELVAVFPPTIFFFIAFNVIIISQKLTLEQYGIKFSGFVNAAVGALIVAKALLVADDIKYINKYPNKPLIYNIVWKTFLYLLVTLMVQYIEGIIPLLVKYHSVKIAIDRGWAEIIWPHFWAVHIVFIFLLSLYVSFRELARAIGEKKFLQIFLGIELTNNNAQDR